MDKLLEHLPIPCLVLLPDPPVFTIANANTAFLATVDFTRIHLVGKPYETVFSNTEKEMLKKGIQQILKESVTEAVRTKEPQTTHIAASDFTDACSMAKYACHWEVKNIPVLDDAGNISYILHTTRNIEPEVKSEELDERYRKLFDYSPIPMWIFDMETLRFIDINKATVENYGYTRDEFLNMTIKDLCLPEDMAFVDAAIDKMRAEDKMHTKNVIRHRKKNGERIAVRIEGNITFLNERKVVVALGMDVTAEQKAQQELSEINQRMKTVQEIAGIGYWTHNLQTGEIKWSDEMYNIIEIDDHSLEVNDINLAGFFHPDDRSVLSQDMGTTFPEGKVYDSEVRMMTAKGNIKWVFQRIRMVRTPDGKPLQTEGIVLDINELRQKEEMLRESNERFELVLKASREAIIDWDIENDETLWGDGFEEQFGYDLEKAHNHLWSDNIHPEDRQWVLDELYSTVEDATKNEFYAEFRFLKANRDTAYVQYRGIFIRDEQGKATRIIGAMTDVTELVKRSKEIEKQNAALREIAWTQSHIVRAPLARLMGLIEVIKPHESTSSENAQLLGYILLAAEELDEVIHRIVKMSENIDSSS